MLVYTRHALTSSHSPTKGVQLTFGSLTTYFIGRSTEESNAVILSLRCSLRWPWKEHLGRLSTTAGSWLMTNCYPKSCSLIFVSLLEKPGKPPTRSVTTDKPLQGNRPGKEILKRKWMRNSSCAESVMRLDDAEVDEMTDHIYLGRQPDPDNIVNGGFIRRRRACWIVSNSSHVVLTDQRLPGNES